ncbi:hypothetical protein HBE99_19555 [Mycobacteroides chelonae]|uniref:hypothetical protein n=1 Tax=Mycobacteroides chelonae TaxID=1774 RepID=UPI0019107C7A|nr:hypothetical protein [Mycobacteroides chelonae]QQG98774.1 hypothetical protein HBE99_19555 [Mycobacteroides chelonae]
MMHTQFFVRMNGDLGAHLLAFREQVELKSAGRLSDDWDEEFGWRELRPRDQGWVNLTLWRWAEDDWLLKLTYEKDPLPAEEAEQLRRKVLDAAAAAGMTITAQSGMESPKPPR